jgi:tRNA threonylcarbamoyladenosine biosynthesis protein TsaB
MLLLAIDTSTSAITVALRGDGIASSATVLDARGHSEHVAPLVRRCLETAHREPSDVTDVLVGTGPGPFTGLRVGIVTGTVFAHARGIPVHGVCSLDALAVDAAALVGEGDFLVATDARRKEVYAATFVLDDRGATRVAGPSVSRASDLDPDVRGLPAAGRGALLYADSLPLATSPVDVSAGALADLAVRRLASAPAEPDGIRQQVEPGDGFDGLEPLYLRRPDAAPAPPSTKSTLG